MEQKIYIPIYAVPMERQRISKSGHCYTPTRTRDFIKECKLYIRRQFDLLPIETGVKLDIEIYKNAPPLSRRYGDIDNLVKSIMDAMTGLVYLDDAQVMQISARKVRSSANLISITITT